MKKIFSFLFLATFFSCTSDSEQTYFGCTNEIAVNYDPAASSDDGSCLFAEGCMDEDACNFNELALEDDGSCEYAEALYYTSSDNNNIETIIANKCYTCHDNYHPEGSLNYTILTIKAVRNQVINYLNGDGIALNNSNYNYMPPPGATPLTNCETEEILMWINNNMPYDENGR